MWGRHFGLVDHSCWSTLVLTILVLFDMSVGFFVVCRGTVPFELVNDGVLRQRGLDTVCIF